MIIPQQTYKEFWDNLEKYDEGRDKVKKIKLQSLRRKYELMFMEEDQKVVDYFSKLITMVNQMKACGETITKQHIVEKVMKNLSPRIDFIVVPNQESKDVKAMKIKEPESYLEAHEPESYSLRSYI